MPSWHQHLLQGPRRLAFKGTGEGVGLPQAAAAPGGAQDALEVLRPEDVALKAARDTDH